MNRKFVGLDANMKTFYIRFINHDINKTGLYWCKTISKRKAINMFTKENNDCCEILEVTW